MVRKEYRYEEVEDLLTGWQTHKVELPSLDEERLYPSWLTFWSKDD